MRRTLFTLAAAASLVLCAAAAGLWVGSYRAAPAPAATPGPSTAAMQVALARRLPEVRFDAVGLGDVLEFLNDVSGVTLDVDWASLRAAGVDRNAPVSMRLYNVRFGDAIEAVLAGQPGVAFSSKGNTIRISTPAGLAHVDDFERPGWGTPAADAALHRWVPRFNGSQGRRRDALQAIGNAVGVPVEADWDALRAAGIYSDQPTWRTFDGCSAAEALTMLLRDERQRQPVQFQLRGPKVVVSTRQRLEASSPPPSWTARHTALLSSAAVAMLAMIASVIFIVRRRGGQSMLPKIPRGVGRAAAVLLLACAAGVAAATGARGPAVREFLREDQRWTLAIGRGSLRLWRSPADPTAPYQAGTPAGTATAPDAEMVFDVAGFSVRRGGSPFNSTVFAAPLWGLTTVAGVLPIGWLILAARRSRRSGRGMCRNCGYDLRATPDRCPECGTVPGKATDAAQSGSAVVS